MFIKKKASKSMTSDEISALIQSRIGQKTIFFKEQAVMCGMIRDYWIKEQGITLLLDTLPAPGLERFQSKITMFSDIKELSLFPNHFHAYQEGWHLFFHPQLVDKVLQTAAENAHNPNSNERFVEIVDAILVSLETLGDE